MGKRPKKCVLIMLAMVWLTIVCAPARADNRVWVGGQVTKSPYNDGKYDRLEVDGVRYRLMSNATIYKRAKSYDGSFTQAPILFSDIRSGQTLELLIQGSRIFKIIVTE